MSKHESDSLEMPGYFLPEDSQLRLAKLRDHIGFLARQAQPRIVDEDREWAPEVSVGELAFCLELLAEQVDRVLAEVSWPAQRAVAANKRERDAVAATAPEISDTADERFAFGVTLDQIDALDRLIQTIAAHGDVVAAGRAAELAPHTLPLLGQAIYDGAKTVRDLLDQVEAQRLGQVSRPRSGVGEERAVYGAGFACLVADMSSGPKPPLPTYPLLVHAGQSPGSRPH